MVPHQQLIAATGSKGRLLTISDRMVRCGTPKALIRAWLVRPAGSIRFAEFVGMKDRAPEVTQAATFVQLAAQLMRRSQSAGVRAAQGQTVMGAVQFSDRVSPEQVRRRVE